MKFLQKWIHSVFLIDIIAKCTRHALRYINKRKTLDKGTRGKKWKKSPNSKMTSLEMTIFVGKKNGN